MDRPKAFLICPVRGHSMDELRPLVEELENHYQVYWPHRDTDQDDPIGFMICLDNRQAIIDADLVLIVWDGKSQGGLIDIGMALMAAKPVKVLRVPEQTDGKSVQNMVREWEKSTAIMLSQLERWISES